MTGHADNQHLTRPEEIDREMAAQLESELKPLLPLLGSLFGLGVVVFGIWDYFIDPLHAYMTVLVRVGLVSLGAIAYLPLALPWTTVQRYGFIYWTHTSAVIISAFLLTDGFVYQRVHVAVCVFMVSILTVHVRTFFLILSVPSLLFVVLTAVRLPLFSFVNDLLVYVFSVTLACGLMMTIRFFRRKAFMLEAILSHASLHDGLTGAANLVCLRAAAEREIALAHRHGRPLALAMMDIDHFKRINDTYGHCFGDRVIRAFVDTCKANLREIDHFGRIGGEEFACVLPETDQAEAMHCAERLRAAIDALRIQTSQGTVHFTVSIGVTLLSSRSNSWEDLLREADIALYRAKHEGRNRIVFYLPGMQHDNGAAAEEDETGTALHDVGPQVREAQR